MEGSKKNDDCYFYYYSTCTKGDSCPFRHEPAALGNETVCSFWQQGKCLKPHCTFRHLELRKNRTLIPCYWEDQPSGCRKPHCPFLHKTPKATAQADSEKTKDLILPVTTGVEGVPETNDVIKVKEEVTDNEPSKINLRRVSQGSEASYAGSPPVDPLVVNFEEESDNESVPSATPSKRNNGKHVHIKTLEEIRLEKIQEESAAFYRYEQFAEESVVSDADNTTFANRSGDVWSRLGETTVGDLRSMLKMRKNTQQNCLKSKDMCRSLDIRLRKNDVIRNKVEPRANDVGFHVKTLGEIRKGRLVTVDASEVQVHKETSATEGMEVPEEADGVTVKHNIGSPVARVQPLRRQLVDESDSDNSMPDIRVKTLHEIRTEKEVLKMDVCEEENCENNIRKRRAHSPIVFDLAPKFKTSSKERTFEDKSPSKMQSETDSSIDSKDGKKTRSRLKRNCSRDNSIDDAKGSVLVSRLRRFAKHLFVDQEKTLDKVDTNIGDASGPQEPENLEDDRMEDGSEPILPANSLNLHPLHASKIAKTCMQNNNSAKDSLSSPSIKHRKIRLKRKHLERNILVREETISNSDPSQSDSSPRPVESVSNTDETASSDLTSGSSTEILHSQETLNQVESDELPNKSLSRLNISRNISNNADSGISLCISSPSAQLETDDEMLVAQNSFDSSENLGTEESILQEIDELLKD